MSSDRAFASLDIWDRVGDRLPWYYAVTMNRMPAKYLIARRIPCDLRFPEATEEELWGAHARLTERFLDLWRAIREGETVLGDRPRVPISLVDLSVELVQRMLRHCNFCRWDCGINRVRGVRHGTCQLESRSRVGSYFHHPGEELVFRGNRGSGTIFFTSCNLRCQFCLSPTTFVLTDRGPAQISQLYEGAGFEIEYSDGCMRFPEHLRTFSPEGRPIKVTKIFKHTYAGPLVLVKPLCAPPLSLTPDHEVLASESPAWESLKKTRAADLKSGDWLAIPRPAFPMENAFELDVASLIGPLAADLVFRVSSHARTPLFERAIALSDSGATSFEIGRKLGYHPTYVRRLLGRMRREGLPQGSRENSIVLEDGRVRLKTEQRPGIPARLRIDRDLAEFLGYFCAEGCVEKVANKSGSHSVVLTFGRHERPLAYRAARLMRSLFGVEPYILERRTSLAVKASKSSLGLLLRVLCGSNSREKKVPGFLFRCSPTVARTFLDAYAKGDGCVTAGYLSLTTVSEKLAMGVFALFLRLGHLPSITAHQPPATGLIEGRRVKQSKVYSVKVHFRRMIENAWASKGARYRYGPHSVLVPIHRVSRTSYSGWVFNLEVDDPVHAYVANFIAVGNCQNGDISHDKDNGIVVTPRQLAAMARQLRLEGCHNINWVGGEPTIHLHTIVEAISLLDGEKPNPEDRIHAEQAISDPYDYRLRPDLSSFHGEFNAPMLWNSNFFMSPETMRILRPLMDVWLPDFKFGNDKCAIYLARTPWYWDTVSKNHQIVYDWGEDMVIRHLVMPDHVECCTKPVLKWIAGHTPRALVNVMDQYHPDYACDPNSLQFDERYRPLARRPHPKEIREAYAYARELGLRFEDVTFKKARRGPTEWAWALER